MDAFIPSRTSSIQELQVDANKTFKWLHFLIYVNLLYQDIVIDDSLKMRQNLENLPTQFMNRAKTIENEVIIRIEKIVARGEFIEKIPEINYERQEIS